MIIGSTTISRTHLKDTIRHFCNFGHLLAFPNIVRVRFLYIDIFPGLHSQNRGRAMPVIRRGNNDRIDTGVIKHLTHPTHGLGFLLIIRSQERRYFINLGWI